MPTREDFETALNEVLDDSQESGLRYRDVSAGELHRLVGGYPGRSHRMPVACSVLRRGMRDGDAVLCSPPMGNGAMLKVRFLLPRQLARSAA